MPPKGFKRKREEGNEDVDLDRLADDDDNSRLTPSTTIRNKDKDAEIGSLKAQKINDLDEEATATDNQQEGNVVEQTHYIIVPSYAAWFDYNAIHQIEKHGNPDFFNGRNKSKTPETYIAYRNFMIDTYRLSPFEYLSATACRRNLTGDICSIVRIHEFLQKWGLINYQVDSDSRPAPITVPPTSHFMVLADTPFGVQPLSTTFNGEKPSQRVQPHPVVTQKEPEIQKNEQTGNVENLKDETKHDEVNDETNEKIPKQLEKMLNEPGLKIDQYSKQGMKTKGTSREWTQQETLLLLEGLEMFKDDWNQVADHVATRTQEECIMHFIQLPIQDPFIEESNSQSKALGPLAYQPIPFSQSGNPVMSTVAFLASVVDPRVASSAAKAALEEYMKMREDIPSVLETAHIKNVEAHSKTAGSKLDYAIGLPTSDAAQKNKQGNEEKTEVSHPDNNEPMEVVENTATKNEQSESANDKSEENELNGKSKNSVEENMQVAAGAALGAAAAKAKYLASVEERRMKGLVAQLVETQMKKLELKLKHFEDLEQIMDKERETLEAQRQQLIAERQAFHQDQLRYLEQRARMDAHQTLSTEGRVPATLPPGFEVGAPPQPQAVIAPSGPPPSQTSAPIFTQQQQKSFQQPPAAIHAAASTIQSDQPMDDANQNNMQQTTAVAEAAQVQNRITQQSPQLPSRASDSFSKQQLQQHLASVEQTQPKMNVPVQLPPHQIPPQQPAQPVQINAPSTMPINQPQYTQPISTGYFSSTPAPPSIYAQPQQAFPPQQNPQSAAYPAPPPQMYPQHGQLQYYATRSGAPPQGYYGQPMQRPMPGYQYEYYSSPAGQPPPQQRQQPYPYPHQQYVPGPGQPHQYYPPAMQIPQPSAQLPPPQPVPGEVGNYGAAATDATSATPPMHQEANKE